MRRTIKLVTLAAMLAAFAAPAWAQAKECNDENKAAWYQKFLDNFKDADKQKVAYEAATTYRDSCPADPSDAQRAYMEKFIVAYEKVHKDADTGKQFEDAVKNGKYAEQMRLGKLVLANDPDNAKVYIILGVVGLNDPSLFSESTQYAKKAVEMIEAGKPFAPLFDGSRDKALAQLNYAIAKANLSGAPTDALPYLIKAARYESDLKKNPQTYLEIGTAYEKGPRAKLTAEYEAKYKGHDETPESKLVAANIDQMIDRQIDALARGVAVATNAADKKALMDELTTLYKYRNKSETGLNELVAGILSKPLPDVPPPITSLPVSTPATSGSPSGTNGATSTNTGTNGQTKTGSTGATGVTGAQNGNKTTTGAKPSPSPTPGVKPKPRRAHHARG